MISLAHFLYWSSNVNIKKSMHYIMYSVIYTILACANIKIILNFLNDR